MAIQKTALRELCQKTFSGGTPTASKPEYWGGGIPWITTADLDGFRLSSSHKTVSRLGLAQSNARVAPAGSLLVGTRVGVGKAAVARIDVAINQDVTACIVDSNHVDPGFLALQLRAPAIASEIQSMKRGATIKGIPRDDLLSLSVLLPELPVQRDLRALLETIEDELTLEERRVFVANELLAALMKELFSRGVDDSDRVETDIGHLPAHWRVVPLGDLARIGNGSTPLRANPAYWDRGDIPWLNSGKIHDVFIDSAEQYVSTVAAKECHLPLVAPGSVVVAITGQGKTLGNAALLRIAATVNQHLAYITPGKDLNPEFLLFFLRTQYAAFRALAVGGGTTKGALTCGALKRYRIPVPPVAEQQVIASVLLDAYQTYASTIARRDQLRLLFHSTLARVFEETFIGAL